MSKPRQHKSSKQLMTDICF